MIKADTMRDRDGQTLRLYRCRGRHASGVCQARSSVLGRLVEPYVVDWFFEHVGADPIRSELRHPDLHELERSVELADADLREYRDDLRIARALGPERFAEGPRTPQPRA